MGGASSETLLLPAAEIPGVIVWSTRTGGQRRVPLPVEGTVLLVEPVDGGFVTAHEGGVVARWRNAAGGAELRQRWKFAELPTGLAVSGDGSHVAVAGVDGAFHVIATAPGTDPLTLEGHDTHVLSTAFSPDGQWLVTASVDRVLLWEVGGSEPVRTLLPAVFTGVVAFAASGEMLVAGGRFGLRRFEVRSWSELSPLSDERQRRVAAARSGRLVAGQTDDGTIRVWDVHSGDQILEMRSEQPPRGFIFDASGDTLWLLYDHALIPHPLDTDLIEAER